LVIGGEKRGISRKILEQSDMNVRIDYAIPFNGSLPSVCATSVLAYEISKFINK
jgi:tRNA G18 (ribose-2'-O)-methylase SpoU